MNQTLIWITIGALALTTAQPAHAGIIYKCRQAGGVTSYQDKPCPGRQIGIIRTSAPAVPAKPASKSSPATPNTTNPSTAATSQRARPTPTARAPRPSFRCTRPDGKVYFSGDARAKRTLIDRARALPTMAPITDAPPPPPGKLWAQDDCQPATRADTCQYYADQITANDVQQARASGDDLRRLTREGQRLRTIRNHRCQ